MGKILLCSVQSGKFVASIDENGKLRVDSTEHTLWAQDEALGEKFSSFKEGYEFISKHTPNRPNKTATPIWAWPATEENIAMMSDVNDGEDNYAIIFEAKTEDCLFSNFENYNAAFSMPSPCGIASAEEWSSCSSDDEEDALYERLTSMSNEEMEKTWEQNILEQECSNESQVTLWEIPKEAILKIYRL